jgi:hypothetical protein
MEKMTKTVAIRILADMNKEIEERMLTDPAAKDRDKASYVTLLLRRGIEASDKKEDDEEWQAAYPQENGERGK